MKEFVIYTALRLGLFFVCLVIFELIGALVFGSGSATVGLVAFVAAVVVSAMLSWRLLRPQREAFAARVQLRAERATSKFEELRSREDAD